MSQTVSEHKLKHLFASAVFLFAMSAVSPVAAECSSDWSSLLNLDVREFDQTPGKGWRILQDKGCFAEAANLIDEYAKVHERSFALAFQSGQLRLKAGDYVLARARFVESKRRDLDSENPLKWNDFVDAYLAFIDNDRERLERARAAIASGAAFWGNKANLSVVDRMLENLGKPYIEAIGAR